PFKGLQPDRVTDGAIRYVSAQEFGALLAASEETDKPLWWKTLLSVCYTCGLRFSEVINLTWPDVCFDSDQVFVAAKSDSDTTIAWTPKDYEHRSIPAPSATMALLAELQGDAAEGHAYVFLSPERVAFIKAGQAAGTWSESRFALNNFHRHLPKLIRQAG